MALSFLQNGVTDNIRNNKRKAKAVLITWTGISAYFKNKLNKDEAKLIRETQWAKDNNPELSLIHI